MSIQNLIHFRFLFLTVTVAGISGCSFGKLDSEFAQLQQNYLRTVIHYFPDWAADEGLIDSFPPLFIPTLKSRNEKLVFCAQYLDSLDAFKKSKLNASNWLEAVKMKNDLNRFRWSIAILRGYEWNPVIYNVKPLFSAILNDEKWPLETRLRLIQQRIDCIPPYYEAAKDNLKLPPAFLLYEAIAAQRGTYQLFNVTIPQKVADSSIEAPEKQRLILKLEAAKLSIKDYIAFCNSKLFEIQNSVTERS